MSRIILLYIEGKQDKSRLPLLLNKYYSEIYDAEGQLQRIAIISTNSCTNIKTYANLKYINQLYLREQFLMIRDGDGKDAKKLKQELCSYYAERRREDAGALPRVEPKNVLILKYYSFENYFLNPAVMAKIGVIEGEEKFYDILKEDIKENLETILIYGRGHNLFDIFYGKYKGEKETEILKKYIDVADRETFADILEAIDRFVYFDSRKKVNFVQNCL
ncbi:MAG: hypothetical protein ACOCNB_10105 [Acetivibrio ethanolgignens]